MPKGTMLVAWQHYNCGDVAQNLPPLRLLKGLDFVDHNDQRRFSDMRFLMRQLDHRLQQKGRWNLPAHWNGDPPLTIAAANDLFQHVEDFFEEFRDARAAKVYSRVDRISQFEWRSCVNIMRAWAREHPDRAAPKAATDPEEVMAAASADTADGMDVDVDAVGDGDHDGRYEMAVDSSDE